MAVQTRTTKEPSTTTKKVIPIPFAGRHVPLPDIIGGPPKSYVSENMREASTPIMEIMPKVPAAQMNEAVFTLENATDPENGYIALLKSHGYTTNLPLKVAFLADSFPSDTFTNEYGESFLSKLTDVVSGGIGEINQMFGQDRASATLEAMGKSFASVDNPVIKAAGAGIGTVLQQGRALKEQLSKVTELKGLMNTVDKMLGGQRVDFPNVWKNSGYSMAYSITVRLWNPSPGSKDITNKYIIGPLVALILLATPQSEEGYAYRWPYFNSVKAQGLFFLDPSVITSISVSRGGEGGQVAWNQSLGLVDVRLDFTSLYGSFVVDYLENKISRPTLRSYIRTLQDPRDISKLKIRESSTRSATIPSSKNVKPGYIAKSSGVENVTNENYDTTAPDRVSPAIVEKQNNLKQNNPLVT